jgi:hypothetical protein
MANPHPKPGPGRRKGSQNKITRAVKDMVVGALERGGGEDWLLSQMTKNPVAFMTLVGKIVPLQVTGEGGGPVIIVTGVQRADDNG